MVVNITSFCSKRAFRFAKECDVNELFTMLAHQLIRENIVSNSRLCKVKE